MTEATVQGADEDELLVGAPTYTTKISVWRALLATAGTGVTAWLCLSPYENSGWLAGFAAIVTLVALGIASGPVNKKLSASYSRELLSQANTEETEENISRAKKIFVIRRTSGNFQLSLFLLAFIGLSIVSIRGITNFDGSGFDNFASFGRLVWQIFLCLICVLLSLICSISYSLTDRSEEISFSPQSTGQTHTLALPVEDRNDIDIAGLGVALQAVMRRAEAYTIESTLLSGLSFSAFIGIAFSDTGPIENASWIFEAISTRTCHPQNWLGLSFCVYDVAPIATKHLMFLVGGLMLICAMLFMSAIIIRFRFNEAFRHTEEILAITRVLNDKESTASPESKDSITAAITSYLEKAKIGFRDMGPLSSAMRMFRNLGVVAFTLAVASCGLYLHPSLFLILIAIIVIAYFFTHVDHLRRKAVFLPHLRSAVMSVFHERI